MDIKKIIIINLMFIQCILSVSAQLDVYIQDQHTHPIGILLSQAVSPPQSLNSSPVIGSYIIEMNSGHTFSPGNEIFMVEINKSFHALVLSVSGNNLTINSPIDQNYTTNSIVFEVVSNMNVDGSTTVEEFNIQVGATANISLMENLGAYQH